MKEWRNHIHQSPELALQEAETPKLIAEKAKSFTFDVVEGIGKTGIVASITWEMVKIDWVAGRF